MQWDSVRGLANASLPGRDAVCILYLLFKSYLLAGISAAGDDGDSADLEELHFVLLCGRDCG